MGADENAARIRNRIVRFISTPPKPQERARRPRRTSSPPDSGHRTRRRASVTSSLSLGVVQGRDRPAEGAVAPSRYCRSGFVRQGSLAKGERRGQGKRITPETLRRQCFDSERGGGADGDRGR